MNISYFKHIFAISFLIISAAHAMEGKKSAAQQQSMAASIGMRIEDWVALAAEKQQKLTTWAQQQTDQWKKEYGLDDGAIEFIKQRAQQIASGVTFQQDRADIRYTKSLE